MVLNHIIGYAVAVVIICIAAFLFVQARTTFSASEVPAGGEEPVLTGENVIRYPTAFNTPLIDPVRTLRYGTKEEDGCRFESRGSVRPGYTMMEGRMLALNPDTCEYIWEEGAVGEEHQEGLMEDDGLGKDSSAQESNANYTYYATKQKVGYVAVYSPYQNWTQTGIEYRYGVDDIWYRFHTCREYEASGWDDQGGHCTINDITDHDEVWANQNRRYTNDDVLCAGGGQGATVTYYYNKVGATVSNGHYHIEASKPTGECKNWLIKRIHRVSSDPN